MSVLSPDGMPGVGGRAGADELIVFGDQDAITTSLFHAGGLDGAGNVDLNFVAAVSFDVLAQMESMQAY